MKKNFAIKTTSIPVLVAWKLFLQVVITNLPDDLKNKNILYVYQKNQQGEPPRGTLWTSWQTVRLTSLAARSKASLVKAYAVMPSNSNTLKTRMMACKSILHSHWVHPLRCSSKVPTYQITRAVSISWPHLRTKVEAPWILWRRWKLWMPLIQMIETKISKNPWNN